MTEQTDEEIVGLVQSGKIELFGVLIDRYEEKMRRYARKFLYDYDDIKDIIQEVFIKVYVNIQSFDAKRKFSPWIYRIAHNELVNNLKKKKKKSLPLFDFNLDTLLPHDFYDDSLNEQIDRHDAQKMVDDCLERLEPKYREPVLLYYLEGLSYKEIADVMRIPVSTAGIRIKRGKEIIKSICKKSGYKL